MRPLNLVVIPANNLDISPVLQQSDAQRLKIRVQPSGTDCRHQTNHRKEGMQKNDGHHASAVDTKDLSDA